MLLLVSIIIVLDSDDYNYGTSKTYGNSNNVCNGGNTRNRIDNNDVDTDMSTNNNHNSNRRVTMI